MRLSVEVVVASRDGSGYNVVMDQKYFDFVEEVRVGKARAVVVPVANPLPFCLRNLAYLRWPCLLLVYLRRPQNYRSLVHQSPCGQVVCSSRAYALGYRILELLYAPRFREEVALVRGGFLFRRLQGSCNRLSSD